ncbi:hypothetical protein PHLGIDRAFT_115979 [Phlebiopsis gigantea 11061_1 CR5-6]|uniref:Uncharacterized protein n=1 Tax=Phlebiopsis gigantea (strain 11061_1 CR5-6) TaxID=745531 RepID=A0A0C3PRI4_PHLG1|nr:hypothetical protein PHLGIDRAFT_115979 [Phlebiopsis gigantea 11061_1 CR5-6]
MPVPLRAFFALRDLALAKHKGSPAPRAALQQPPKLVCPDSPCAHPSSSAPETPRPARPCVDAGAGARSDAAARRSDQPAAPRAPALQTGRPPARLPHSCGARDPGPACAAGGEHEEKEGARD